MEKKKVKNLGLWIGILFVIVIVGIIIYMVVVYNNDQNAMKDRMKKVEEDYTTFKEHVEKFNEKRNEIYETIMQDMYYQTLKDNDEKFKKIYKEYRDVLGELDTDYDTLKKRCINVLYPDVSINNKCEAFVLGYEEVVNTYVSDVEVYNKNIKQYNEWLKETNSQDSTLEEVKSDKDYLDVNGDRIFRGKEEVKNAVGELKDEKE